MLDLGLLEKDFWSMTYAEVERYVESRKRVELEEQRKKASFDYILADLIGRSVSRIYKSSNKLPSLSDAYPSLFNSETENQAVQQKKDELSALRFTQFAQSYNSKFKEAGKG